VCPAACPDFIRGFSHHIPSGMTGGCVLRRGRWLHERAVCAAAATGYSSSSCILFTCN
jgi:hypothetical protein